LKPFFELRCFSISTRYLLPKTKTD
jgi:hypothetical protein